MPKTISAAAITESEKVVNRPVTLVELYLGSQTAIDSDTQLFAQTNQDVVSLSQTYKASGIGVGSVQKDSTGRINVLNIALPNVKATIGIYPLSNYVLSFDIRGKRVRVFKVFFDLLDDQTTIFDGYISHIISVDEAAVAAEVTQKTDFLTVQLPKHTYEEKCPWRFAGGSTTPCNYDPTLGVGVLDSSTQRPFLTCNKSRTNCTARDMLVRFRGIPFK